MADALIAKLDIALRGNTQDLDQNLDKAGAGLNRFKGAANNQCASIDKSLSNIGQGVSGAMQNAFMSPIGAIKSALGSIANVFLHPIDTIKSAGVGLISTFRSIGDSIRAVPMNIISGISNAIKSLGSTLSSLKGGACSAFSSLASLARLENADRKSTRLNSS